MQRLEKPEQKITLVPQKVSAVETELKSFLDSAFYALSIDIV